MIHINQRRRFNTAVRPRLLSRGPCIFFLAALIVLGLPSPGAYAQGIALSGIGAVNRSMGGAAAAGPIDAAGALHWNPASISELDPSAELSFEVLAADTEISSRIDALGAAGSTDNDASPTPIPAVALIHREPGAAWTWGAGFYAVAGFSVNYPADPGNPIAAPPAAGGFGRLIGEAEVFQFVPTAAYKTGAWSFGVAPVLTVARVQADPLFFAAPNVDGRYPPGADSDYSYGGGFQVGALHSLGNGWTVGASYKSPQWLDSFDVNSLTAEGAPRRVSFEFDYPQIVTLGLAYSGFDRLLIAADVRYFDFGETDGFKRRGFSETGAVDGLGWNSIFAAAVGVQYEPSERLKLRIGYTYGENPIEGEQSLFNVISPLITEHQLAIGAGYQVTKKLAVSLSYWHAFYNSIEGPIVHPAAGALPGTSVKSQVSADSAAVAFTLSLD